MTTIVKLTHNFASNWQRRMEPAESQKSRSREQCPHCGARIASRRLSLSEIMAAAFYGSLLLSITVPAYWATEQWVERQARLMLD